MLFNLLKHKTNPRANRIKQQIWFLPAIPSPRTWPEKNQVQHIPKRPIIYCGSKSLCRDDKLTAPFPKDIPLGMYFGKHSCSCGLLQALVRKQLLPDSI